MDNVNIYTTNAEDLGEYLQKLANQLSKSHVKMLMQNYQFYFSSFTTNDWKFILLKVLLGKDEGMFSVG